MIEVNKCSLFYFHMNAKDETHYKIKIEGQYDTYNDFVKSGALKKFEGIETTKILNNSFSIVLNEKEFAFNYSGGNRIKYLFLLPKLFSEIRKYLVKNKFSVVYIRRLYWQDCSFLLFLKHLKKAGIRIILELPTYPYDKEIEGTMAGKVDFFTRKYLYKYVSRIATFSDDNYIFGIKTIRIENGVIVGDIAIKEAHNEMGTIQLIAVAGIALWHGYDRLIMGLAEYYNNGGRRNIVFHIVGGDENNLIRHQYENITKKYAMEDHVIFYGNQNGEALDKIYNKCSIAIECLGCHRKNIFLSSSLKSREYAAKGLPMVTSCKIDVFPEDHPYILNVPSDESAIDINTIIEFHDNLYETDEDYEKVATKMRQYAFDHCDMKMTMKPIVDYINEISVEEKK